MQQPDEKANKANAERLGWVLLVLAWACAALLGLAVVAMMAKVMFPQGLTVETNVTTGVAPACSSGETHTTVKFNIRLGR